MGVNLILTRGRKVAWIMFWQGGPKSLKFMQTSHVHARLLLEAQCGGGGGPRSMKTTSFRAMAAAPMSKFCVIGARRGEEREKEEEAEIGSDCYVGRDGVGIPDSEHLVEEDIQG